VTWPGPRPARSEARLVAEAAESATAAQVPGGDMSFGGLAPPEPPQEVRNFLAALSLGRPLRPVAHLKTLRQRAQVLVEGQPAAEIDEDEVEGSVLVKPPAAGAPCSIAWKEFEVEAAEGAGVADFRRIVGALVASGARPSHAKSKLGAVLSAAGLPSAEHGHPKVDLSALRGKATVADVLQAQAQACLDTLVEHDPAIRLGDSDPEHVHKARVATRRLRSLLWALRRSRTASSGVAGALCGPGDKALDPAALPSNRLYSSADGSLLEGAAMAWVNALRSELRWLGAALGAARDADVRLATLGPECARLSAEDQPAAVAVLDAARSDQIVAHQTLLEVMNTERYVAVLRSLEALATGAGRLPPGSRACHAPSEAGQAPTGPSSAEAPPLVLWQRLEVPAVKVIAQLGAAQWRSARRAARRLGPAPSGEALHRLRIQAKRLRYIAEAAAPVFSDKSRRSAALLTVAAATQLQDVLGELHDAAARENWLRAFAARAPGADADALRVAFVAGELCAASRANAERYWQAWQGHWRRLNKKSLALWTR
jgi:CHAD domain-containing protein